MNKNIKLLVIFILITMNSCQDDWLKPTPLSIYTPESVYVNRAGMEAVLTKLRQYLRVEINGNIALNLGEYYSSDIGVSPNTGANTIIDFRINVLPTGTGAPDLFRYWNLAYNSIRESNMIISRIDFPEWKSEKEKNEILAEAYFFRAYWYYRLVNQFGNVPFLSKEYTAPKIDFFTHSRKTILNQIQNDLIFSVQWLPEFVIPGKVNRAAGNHLLTKVYLANSLFDEAILSATRIIESGNHQLMNERFGSVANNNRFNVIWDLHRRENKSIAANKEGILISQDRFEFPEARDGDGTNMMRNWTPWWTNASYLKDPEGKAAMSDVAWEPQLIALGRGTGYFRTSNYFNYELWLDCGSDLRHDNDTNWFSVDKFRYNNPASKYYNQPFDIKYTNPRDTFRAYYPWPQYKIYIPCDHYPERPRGGHSDWYIFRLAETYLLRAEAYFWKNDLAKAADDINKVRARALAPLITQNEVSLSYILDERARELYTEEPRKTELTRIAYILAENNLSGYSIENFHLNNFWFDRIIEKNFYNQGRGILYGQYVHYIEPYHVLWPVPQADIDSNPGGHINQNLGYPGSENNITPLTEVTDNQ